jgi:hypothetical protein
MRAGGAGSELVDALPAQLHLQGFELGELEPKQSRGHPGVGWEPVSRPKLHLQDNFKPF